MLKNSKILAIVGMAGMMLTQAHADPGKPTGGPNHPMALKEKVSKQKNQFFVKNEGQVTSTEGEPVPDVKYTYNSGPVTLYFQEDRVSYVYPKREYKDASNRLNKDSTLKITALYRMDVIFKGANDRVSLNGKQAANSYSNYFLGNRKANKVPHQRKLVYNEIYPGIDLIFKFKDGKLKYEYVVHEKGDPSDIRMDYTGAENVAIQKEGRLKATTPFGELEEAKPVAFKKSDPGHQLGCHFTKEKGHITFQMEKDNPEKPYVIDPYLSYSTFLGGGSNDQINDIAVNNLGNDEVYVVGQTNSTRASFPIQSGKITGTHPNNDQEGFIAEYSANGQTLNWFTFYGSGGNDRITGVDINYLGSGFWYPYVVGESESGSLPGSATNAANGGTNPGNQSIFVAYVNNSGAIGSHVFIGSPNNDYSGNIIYDNEIYICGTNETGSFFTTSNAPFPRQGGTQEGILANFKDLNTLDFSLYYGGGGYDIVRDVDKLPSGDLVIQGTTNSSTSNSKLINVNGYQQSNQGGDDQFLARFTSAGNFVSSTYIGGSSTEYPTTFNTLAVDQNGNIHLTGTTVSSDFPVTGNAWQSAIGGGNDAFYTRMTDLSTLDYSTFFGGSYGEAGQAIITYSKQHFVLSGNTTSSDMPINLKNGSFQSWLKGQQDAFVAEFTQDKLKRSTYFGGTGKNESFDCLAISQGNSKFFAGGYSESSDFPTTANATQSNKQSTRDATLVGFSLDPTCKYPNKTSLTNQTYNASTTLSGNYEINGYLEITSGTLTINNANLIFGPCAILRVKNGADLNIDNSSLKNCGDHWKGILVKDPNSKVTINDTRISDAKVALEANQPSQFEVTNSYFENNLFYVALRKYSNGSQKAKIHNNSFIKQNGASNFCTGYTRPQTYYAPNVYKMIWVNNSKNGSGSSKNLSIKNNNLETDREYFTSFYNGYVGLLLNQVENAIVKNNFYDLEGQLPTARANNLNDVNFDTEELFLNQDKSGLIVENSSNIKLRNTLITGQNQSKGKYGIILKNISKPASGKNKIKSARINSCKTSIRMKKVRGTLVGGSSQVFETEVKNSTNGIEYYAKNNYTYGTKISRVIIYRNKFGIVAAPEKHPHNAPSTANTSTNQINLDIECNKLWNNEVGIFGSGNLKDQGSSRNNNNTPAGNNFDDPNNTTPGVSRNTEWDILWQYRNGSSGFKYYHYYSQNKHYYKPNTSSTALNYKSYTMNGVSQHPCGSSTCQSSAPDPDYTYPAPASSKQPNVIGCYAQWKRNPTTNVKKPETDQGNFVEVYPNPFNKEVQVSFQRPIQGMIQVTNLQGQQITKTPVNGASHTFRTADWKPGAYFIKLIPDKGHVRTRKLLKVQ